MGPHVPMGPYVPGHGAHGGPKKNILEKESWGKKSWKKHNFLEAVNQLKKTSDCIQIHPPGPRKKLKKKKEAVYQLKKTNDYSQIHPPGPEQNLKKHIFSEKN